MSEEKEQLYTLRLTVEKIKQDGVVEQEDKVIVESNNLTLKNVQDMRSELLPVLAGFNAKDEA